MLNWEEKIDNEKIFQKLVNHLFALECNSPGFIPSSPYIGADGAWDGFYEGRYAQENQTGIWSIQSKWTKKSFKEAHSWQRTEIKKELKNANKNKVQHLRIATNAELKVEQVRDLEGLNKGEVATLKVWHRERLTLRVEQQPFLKSLFFELPQHPKFVPSNLYFDQIEKDLLPASKIEKFKEYAGQVKGFLLSESSILLIHSPGGYGKSHLLRDISQEAHKIDPNRQSWMTRQGHRSVEDAIQDEIIKGRNYLLIFDDADRFLDEARSLIAFARHEASAVKLVLTLRTSGLRPIHEILRQLRCEAIYGEISISDWSRNDLVQLLRIAAEQGTVEDEEILAALYPNPYLMVWIGRQKRKAPSMDFKKVKEKFVNDVDFEADRCLKDVFTSSEIKEFITNLACIAPLSMRDEILLGKLAEKFGRKIEVIKGKIDALVEAGVLRTVGNSIRFSPDMRGDVYLAYELEKARHEELNRLVKDWLTLCAEKLFVNLEGAAKYGNVPALEKIFSEIVDTWTKEATKTPRFIRDERLKLSETVARLAPKSCFNLMYSYLHSEAPVSQDKYLKSLESGMNLTTDDFGPVIITLFKIPDLRKEILPLLEEIHAREIEGFYDNYKPLTLVRHSLSPLHNSPKEILNTLAVFVEWLKNPNQYRIELISAGLTEILAGSHAYTKSTIGGIEFGDKILRPTKEITEIRDRAMHLLIEMLRYPSSDVQLAALKVAEGIGSTRGGVGPRRGMPLSDRIAKDTAVALEEIAKRINPEADFQLLNKIENLFIRWWGLEIPGAEKAADYLRNFPRSVEYIVFRYFASPDYVIIDFEAIEKQVPDTDRWGWLVHNIMHNDDHSKPEYFKPEVEMLIQKYDSQEKAVGFLMELHERISGYDRWPRPQIVRCWVRLEQEKFASIRGNKELWEKVPERFRNEIDLALSEMDTGFIKKLAEEVLPHLPSAPISKVDTFLTMLGRQEVDEKDLRNWLMQIAEKGDKEHRLLLVIHLDHVLKKIPTLMLEILNKCVSMEEELNPRMTDNLSFIIHRIQEHPEEIDNKLLDHLRDELLRKLKDVPELDWDADELLRFSFSGIDSAINFVEYRLQKSMEARKKSKRRKKLDAVPFDGLKSISGQIKSYADFEKLMERVIDWHKEDMLYRKFYLEYLMEPILGLSDKGSQKTFLEEYIDKQILEGHVQKAMTASEYLPINENTSSLLVKVSEKAMETGASKDVERMLFAKTLPKGGWEGKPGEAPPALEELKGTFQKMEEMAKPGELKVLIGRCVASIDVDIKDHLKRDEEFLTPRG
ncbi:MAG: hypothetical protein FJ106_14280 [Deltaproteobacteria bacterium]|nr:hypothetical protein [Deltaproteobacteria bacterium]